MPIRPLPAAVELPRAAEGLARLLAQDDGPSRPSPAFLERAQLVHTHLAFIHSTESLVESFGREASNRGSSAPHSVGTSPVYLAYAVRWMELMDGSQGSPWTALTERVVPAG